MDITLQEKLTRVQIQILWVSPPILARHAANVRGGPRDSFTPQRKRENNFTSLVETLQNPTRMREFTGTERRVTTALRYW